MQLDPAVKTLIWDLDGTLIDSFEIYAEILAEAVRLNSLVMPDKSVLKINFHGSLEDSITQSLGLSDEVIIVKLLQDFLRVQERFYAMPDEHLFEDALQLARRAHVAGLRQILVTNRAHQDRGNASPRYIVDHSQLAGMIEYIVCGDEVEYRKPDARVLDSACADLGLELSSCLIVGDQFVDAQLAHNLGLNAILVDREEAGIAHLGSLHDDARYTVVASLDTVTI